MPKNYKLRSGWKFWKGKKKKKKRKRLNLVKFSERKNEALRNQKNKSLINFDEEYSNSIKSIAVEQSNKVNLATRFLNGKRLMFSKVSIKSLWFDWCFYVPKYKKNLWWIQCSKILSLSKFNRYRQQINIFCFYLWFTLFRWQKKVKRHYF